MPSFSVLNFRRGRKGAPRAPPAEPPRPASPASFFSPGSPELESPPLLILHTDHANPLPTPPSESSFTAKPPRPPRTGTPELDLNWNFDASFSISDLFLPRSSSVKERESKDVASGAGEASNQDDSLLPNLTPPQYANASQTSISSSGPSFVSPPTRRPAPAPIQIPNPIFRPTAKVIAENPSDAARRESKSPPSQNARKRMTAHRSSSLAHGTPRHSIKSAKSMVPPSSVHSSGIFPEILSSMFILPPERTSETFGHAKQDSALLPIETPGHRIPSLYQRRDSRSSSRKSMSRRTSLPLLNVSSLDVDIGDRPRPVSAISPSKSPLETSTVEDGTAGAPVLHDAPPRPTSSLPASDRAPSAADGAETCGETSTDSIILPELSTPSASTAPTSASLHDRMALAMERPPILGPSGSSEDVKALKEMAFSAAQLAMHLETVPEVPTPSTDRTKPTTPSAAGFPSSPYAASFRSRRRSMEGSSRPVSQKSKTNSMSLPIGISDPITRKRASAGVPPSSPGGRKEKHIDASHYGQLPPSAVAPSQKAPSKPPASMRKHIRPLPSTTRSRSASHGSVADFPSPPVVLAAAPKLDSATFPQTANAWSSVESSPEQSHAQGLLLTLNTSTSDNRPDNVERSQSVTRDTSRRASLVGGPRKPGRPRPALPIGPRKAPNRSTSGPTAQASPGFSTLSLKSSSPGLTATRHRPRSRPQTPTFETRPPPWRGLTLEAAQWTYTSDELQEIVGRAIHSGIDASSIRLLNTEILDVDLPEEEERLETKRDQLKSKFRTNSRRRRLLLRELERANDPTSVGRLASELAEENALADQLTDNLYSVSDQLAQLTRLRDAHSSSALSLALRKLNKSLDRRKTELLEMENKVAQLEAEREEAWAVAESVEGQLNDLRQQLDEMTQTKAEAAVEGGSLSRSSSARSSRVSAARKASLRASKASLRLSLGRSKSMRSSSSSVRYASIVWPRSSTGSVDPVPPVPPIPSKPTSLILSGPDPLSPTSGSREAMSAVTSYTQAKREVYELLGLEPIPTPRLLRRTQSMSTIQTLSAPLSGIFTTTESPATSSVGPLPSPLVKSWSVDLKGRPRRSVSVNGAFFMYPQRLTDLLETVDDPDSNRPTLTGLAEDATRSTPDVDGRTVDQCYNLS